MAAKPSTNGTAEQAVEELRCRIWEGLSQAEEDQLREFLRGCTDIFAALPSLVQHYINTGSAAPSCERTCRLPLAKCEAAESVIREMAAAGVIEPSDSP